jgi:hypothetical protein
MEDRMKAFISLWLICSVIVCGIIIAGTGEENPTLKILKVTNPVIIEEYNRAHSILGYPAAVALGPITIGILMQMSMIELREHHYRIEQKLEQIHTQQKAQ